MFNFQREADNFSLWHVSLERNICEGLGQTKMTSCTCTCRTHNFHVHVSICQCLLLYKKQNYSIKKCI